MDLAKEIKELREASEEIFEGGNAKEVVTRAYLKGEIGADKAAKLGKKALRIPSDNDYYVNDEGDYDFSGLTGKTATKASNTESDMRRVMKGRSREELEAKREADEKNDFKQAIAKSIRRNKIKKEIKELKEAFEEIFEADKKEKEVNKIKYEKDKGPGKEPTEVVSVADELFPYKGSAKEQFNQKIIAKINDMIEGTATLEDLINLVRRKKVAKVSESIEEAMALMEAIISEVSDELKKRAQQKADDDLKKAQIDKDNKVAAYELGNLNVSIEDVKDAIKNVQKHAGRAAKLDNAIIKHDLAKIEGRIKPANESLEGAISLMEDIFSTIMKQPMEDRGRLMYKYHQIKSKDTRDTYTKGQEEEKHKSKEEKGEEKTKQRKLYKGRTIEDWKQGRLMDQIARNAKNLGKNEDPATAKSISRHQVKEWKKGVSESIEEALSLMETIVNELLDSTVDSSSEKRAENRAKAFAKYLENPNPETRSEYKTAEKKDNRNLHLSMSRDNRHGVYNTLKAGRVSMEKVEKDPGKYIGDNSVPAAMLKKALEKQLGHKDE